MIVEDVCKKLRPIQGRKIDRLWQAYSIENTDGKRDIEQMLQILYTKTFPGGVLQDDSGLYPPPEKLVQGEYPIGTVTYANRDLF
ncbi:MAG: hypothetical protein HOC71_10095, partial [Candidatus Latescibacteria bacterium]|nr:hypothetical protein [Candidatus Latescibacterota bacterium]